jgi:DNA polymerase
MSLDLDDRQRAMLQEMGVHVWWPRHEPSEVSRATEAVAVSAQPVSAAGQKLVKDTVPLEPSTSLRPATSNRKTDNALVAGVNTLNVLPEGISSMDWPTLDATLAQCRACAMGLGRRLPVMAAPAADVQCDWMVVGDPPDEAQERAGLPFVDEAGQLLNNMLRAVGVQRYGSQAAVSDLAGRAYLTHVLKCRPARMRAPDATELATCAHYLRREIALISPKVILVMGRFAMQVLLSETPPENAKLPLGKLRGQVWRFAGVPVVVTYPPAYLLRSGEDKAKAWADLCLAADVVSG